MVIFYSYVSLPEGKCWFWEHPHLHLFHLCFHLEPQDSSCAEDAETEAQRGECSMETKCHGARFVEWLFYFSISVGNPWESTEIDFMFVLPLKFRGIPSNYQMPVAKETWNMDVEWVAPPHMKKKTCTWHGFFRILVILLVFQHIH